jgi:beta-phosphoglucomutase-like phosphatase (HAD superfamily)
MSKTIVKNAQCFLFFELETVALNGRKLAFDASVAAFEKKSIEITFQMFVKHGLGATPQTYVSQLMAAAGKAGAGTKLLEEEIRKVVFDGLKSADFDKCLLKLISEAQKRDIRVFAVSSLPQEQAEELFVAHKLADKGVELYTTEEVGAEFPRTETWLTLSRNMELEPRACITLTSSRNACKGALTADMVGIACPDEFTSFDDFSGAHFVLDAIGDMKPAELIDAVLMPA